MIEARIVNLGLDGVAGISRTEHSTRSGVLAGRITGLYHKVFDHTMKQHSVIISFGGKFQEIFLMFRSCVIQQDLDGTDCCFYIDNASGLDRSREFFSLLCV